MLRFSGGNKATDVVPGTPGAVPQTEQTGKSFRLLEAKADQPLPAVALPRKAT